MYRTHHPRQPDDPLVHRAPGGRAAPVKILTRYVLKEHVGPLLFSGAALTALLLLQQVAKRFGDLVGKGLSWGVIGEFFVLSVPFIIAMTLPMAVLVAVLYAYSRLAAENEVTALRASGVSLLRIVQPVLWGSVVIAIIMLGFNDQVLSRSNHRLRTLQTDIARKKPTFALREQVMNEVLPGKFFLKTGHIDQASNKLREVTIYDFSDATRPRTVYADSGRMGITPDMQDLEMTLFDGYSTTVPRDQPGQLERVFFQKDFVRVRGVGNELQRTKEDNYKGSREMSVCEMEAQYQRKFAEYTDARTQLADALAETARREITGRIPEPKLEAPRTEAAPPPKTPQHPQRPTIGGVYCSLVTRVTQLLGVQTASAAELPRQGHARPQGTQQRQAPQQQQAPSARRGRKAQQAQAATPQAKKTPPPHPMLNPPPGAVIVRESQSPARATTRMGPPPRQPVLTDAVLSSNVARLMVMQSRATETQRTMSDFAVEIQKKFALAAACIVFVILGAPIALRFPRGGVGLVIGVSIVVFALYYVGLIAGQTLANHLIISPFWSMWLANIVFTAVGIVLMFRVQRSSGSARGGDASELVDLVRSWIARQVRRVGIPADRRRTA